MAEEAYASAVRKANDVMKDLLQATYAAQMNGQDSISVEVGDNFGGQIENDVVKNLSDLGFKLKFDIRHTPDGPSKFLMVYGIQEAGLPFMRLIQGDGGNGGNPAVMTSAQ